MNNGDLYITYQIVAQFTNMRWGKSLYKKCFMHMNVFVFKLMWKRCLIWIYCKYIAHVLSFYRFFGQVLPYHDWCVKETSFKSRCASLLFSTERFVVKVNLDIKYALEYSRDSFQWKKQYCWVSRCNLFYNILLSCSILISNLTTCGNLDIYLIFISQYQI